MIAEFLLITVFGIMTEMEWQDHLWANIIVLMIAILALLVLLLYLFTRITTLVLAFTTLRALPSRALETVDWTTFIPHL
jgi:flagellar biogenesis protein FliO